MSSVPTIKTSQSSPLRIAEVRFHDTVGLLGLTTCPGKTDPSRGWQRDLAADLRLIQSWGASTVVTLIEDFEFELLEIPTLGEMVEEMGMRWIHTPIRDGDRPDERFEGLWESIGPELHRRVETGERILIHCRGGLGRTGLVAALLLIERGCPARDAMHRVRAVRPGAIETSTQEGYVLAATTRPRGGDDEKS